MIHSEDAAPVLADAITLFLIERGIIKIPNIEEKEATSGICFRPKLKY